jgi:multiple sugar transport system permease protein
MLCPGDGSCFFWEKAMDAKTQVQPLAMGSFISRKLHKDSWLGYALISPGFTFLTIMMAYPFVYAIYLSFTDKQIGATANFTGFENYSKLASTNLFWDTVINSLLYTTVALLLKFFGGLGLALMLNRPFIGQRLVKALLLLPWIMPTVFSTMIWSWIFHPTFSIANEVLVNKLGLLIEPIPFLLDERWAMASLILVNVWRGVPFFGITFLAAIQSVPTEMIEASRIDGASPWVSFWRIIFPMILPVVIIVMLISTIGTLGDFDLPFLLTNGGPNNATTMFSLTAYTLSLQSGLIGLGAAVTMTMFPLLVLLVIFSLLSIRRQQQQV